METRVRGEYQSLNNLSDFFLTPTNHTFRDFSSAFGNDVAESIYKSLYKTTYSKNTFRQIFPVKILSDRVTTKYAFELFDKRQIETVVIKRRTGNTICLSTQVGCPVQCRFCKSGKKGLIRNLSTSEIIQQFLFVNEKINRIVFMGIGEPLYNYNELIRAIHILRDRNGLDFPTDGISISTVGPIEKLKMLREEHIKVQLVLSLHATDQETRDYLIPRMSANSINEVIALTMDYGRRHNRKVTIAYLLLPGINDRKVDSERLARWFGNKNVIINLLKYNGRRTHEFGPASAQEFNHFKDYLEQANVQVTLRKSMGESIDAACGELVIKNNLTTAST
jgi:23S rRNA (adenine2503-C2)-methyltransferase